MKSLESGSRGMVKRTGMFSLKRCGTEEFLFNTKRAVQGQIYAYIPGAPREKD